MSPPSTSSSSHSSLAAVLILPLLLLSTAAGADEAKKQMSMQPDSSGAGYHAAMEKMQEDTPKEMSGDPDHDFAMMMIPHHQAAIDMAKVELQYGKDPELKKMAEDIIESQQTEIATMKEWLTK